METQSSESLRSELAALELKKAKHGINFDVDDQIRLEDLQIALGIEQPKPAKTDVDEILRSHEFSRKQEADKFANVTEKVTAYATQQGYPTDNLDKGKINLIGIHLDRMAINRQKIDDYGKTTPPLTIIEVENQLTEIANLFDQEVDPKITPSLAYMNSLPPTMNKIEKITARSQFVETNILPLLPEPKTQTP